MTAGHARHVSVEPFVTGDPITKLLLGYWHVKPWLATVIIVLVINIPVVVLAAINNILFSQGNRIGLLQDYAWWIYQFLSVPATVFFFLWLPKGVNDVLMGL